MPIYKQVKAVERLYKELDAELKKYYTATHLKCPSGCIHCCLGENISASPLEFLPYAYAMYKSGELESIYFEFKEYKQVGCFLLDWDHTTEKGKCGIYSTRGLVCRLFGSGARLDKNGLKQFVGCRILKDELEINPTQQAMVNQHVPIITEYYSRLRSIDLDYGSLQLPINLAILKALELVFYHTRRYNKMTV